MSEHKKNGKVGAVMVVGSGIAGIQAALDLANSGMKVYMVENGISIGGVMAQLDKTFPTNDCSACILSPKLVEVGRHPNVEILTRRTVESVEGEPGRFTVKLTKAPRFIDLSKCTGCGDCAAVCPITVKADFNENLSDRKATYRHFPQAIPSGFAIDKLGTAPCKAACPTHISVQGYVALIAAGKYKEALRLIKQENPFPSVCGRVCNHPCEEACMRGRVEQPIDIMHLKRFVADLDLNDATKYIPEIKEKKGKKVAVVGAGPAGLTCAYYLTIEGYDVTVYEKAPIPGGWMTLGIPEYRLPRDVLNAEIQTMTDMGVKILCNQEVGRDITLEQLRKDYDALFLGVGAQLSSKLDIPGEEMQGVIHGVDYLKRVNLGEKVFLGEKVAVIGGGNVAMDATRSAIRLGAKKATCVYRRRKEDMPALADEVEGAIAEGAELKTLLAPAHIETDEYGHAKALWAKPQITGPIGMDGRPMPVPAAGPEVRVPADLIVLAVGQDVVAKNFVSAGVELKKNGTISAESTGKLTGQKNVFAGGDCVTGPATVIKAIAAGKVAAANIDQSLGFHHMISTDVQVPNPRLQGYPPTGRVQLTEREASERRQDFRCIECGMTGEEAQQESLRCLRCDHFGYGIFKGGRIERW